MSLPPCCPYHPAGVSCRLGQPAPCHAAFAPKEGARPPDLYFVSRPLLGSLSLRPGDLLTIPKMALSVGFIRFVFSTDMTQAKGLLTFTPVGLLPTEHVCLSWTHSLAKTLADRRINSLQQYFQSLIWYNPMPCSACFSSGSEH